MKKAFYVAAVIATALGSGAAMTADYPSKSVDYVIPFGPGGESDVTARLQQPYFKDKFGQDLVVSYKPGGGGAVGWSQLNGMGGDGHSIMGINLPHIVVKPKQGDVGFQTEDVTAVYMFHYTPDAIVVNADSNLQTLQELIDYAKANPKRLTMSGSGKGTANHLAQVIFDQMADIETTYVPQGHWCGRDSTPGQPGCCRMGLYNGRCKTGRQGAYAGGGHGRTPSRLSQYPYLQGAGL